MAYLIYNITGSKHDNFDFWSGLKTTSVLWLMYTPLINIPHNNTYSTIDMQKL